MTVIVDYGVGNLFSLISSFRKIGEEAVVSPDPSVIAAADRIILPGVGAFGDAVERLRKTSLDEVLKAAKQPLLGICLGMQLLFDKSYEYGEHEGLGLIPGVIRPIAEKVTDLKIPHMGWNALDIRMSEHPLLKYTRPGEYVYFVHSYYADCGMENVAASAEYGIDIPAAAARGNVAGCQFHPEKSGDAGLRILKAFCEMKGADAC